MKMPSAAQRRYLYAVAIAAFPVLVAVGWIDVKAAPLALALVLAILNVRDPE